MVEVKLLEVRMESANRRRLRRGYSVVRAADGAQLIQPPFPSKKTALDFIRHHRDYRLVPY